MSATFLAMIDDEGPAAVAVVGESVRVLPGRPSLSMLLADWDGALEQLDAQLAVGELGPALDAATTRFLAPLRPTNLYMIGANYADHAREMRGLGPHDPVERPPEGPFVFLKPTTTVIGDGEPILLGPGCAKVDWEAELAVVIARPAHRVTTADALACVAGYTIANDVSARDRFRRENTEPPLTFDWFSQKGWEASCPLGPWLLPARDCPDPDDLAISLTRNGNVEQSSRTSEMLFSVAELVSAISTIVPLVPGDVICTGTCAGVGAARGTFLAPGDVVRVEIESIGVLQNPVERAA